MLWIPLDPEGSNLILTVLFKFYHNRFLRHNYCYEPCDDISEIIKHAAHEIGFAINKSDWLASKVQELDVKEKVRLLNELSLKHLVLVHFRCPKVFVKRLRLFKFRNEFSLVN